jgi:hypothetical protein
MDAGLAMPRVVDPQDHDGEARELERDPGPQDRGVGGEHRDNLAEQGGDVRYRGTPPGNGTSSTRLRSPVAA